jgi:hypothetical protein
MCGTFQLSCNNLKNAFKTGLVPLFFVTGYHLKTKKGLPMCSAVTTSCVTIPTTAYTCSLKSLVILALFFGFMNKLWRNYSSNQNFSSKTLERLSCFFFFSKNKLIFSTVYNALAKRNNVNVKQILSTAKLSLTKAQWSLSSVSANCPGKCRKDLLVLNMDVVFTIDYG